MTDETIKRKPKRYVLKDAPAKTCATCGGVIPSDTEDCCPKCKTPLGDPATAPDFIAELKAAFLSAQVESDHPDEGGMNRLRERFSVTDEATAAWAAGKIALWQNEIERRKAQAAKYVKEAESTLARLEWLFMDQLRAWAKANLPPGRRSIKLASATLAFRDTPARLEVTDEKLAKKWAILNCADAIVTEERLLLEPLKAAWLKTGVIPEGTKEIPSGESFHVKG